MIKILLAAKNTNHYFGHLLGLPDYLYTVNVIEDGFLAAQELQSHKYDIALISMYLSQISGLIICKRFRASGGTTPIIVLAPDDSIEQREEAIDAGADDCVNIHSSLRELLLRIRALTRWQYRQEHSYLNVPNFVLNCADGLFIKDGQKIKLNPMEFALMEFFMRHPNQSFTAQVLHERVWLTRNSSSDTVRTHIKTLRRKISSNKSCQLIKNIRSRGYKLELNVDDHTNFTGHQLGSN